MAQVPQGHSRCGKRHSFLKNRWGGGGRSCSQKDGFCLALGQSGARANILLPADHPSGGPVVFARLRPPPARPFSGPDRICSVLHNSLLKQVVIGDGPLWGRNPTAILFSARAQLHQGVRCLRRLGQPSKKGYRIAVLRGTPSVRNSLYRKAFNCNYTFGIGTGISNGTTARYSVSRLPPLESFILMLLLFELE